MYRRRLFILGLAALLFCAAAKPLHAAPPRDDEVIVGDNLTLHEGEHINGNLVLLGGNLTMRAGSRVEGSITVLGGRAEIDGTVTAQVVVFGGDVALREHARVGGEVVVLGGRVRQAEGAQVTRIVEGLALRDAEFWRGLRAPCFSLNAGFWSPAWMIAGAVFSALLMALLGMAIVHFWPAQTAQVGKTILIAPLPSLGVGCLLYPLTATLTVLVLLTICLSPLVPLVILLLVMASLLGWVALGRLLGCWLGRWLGWRGGTPWATAGVGVFALTFSAAVANALPCLGALLTLGAASIGLGAVALSRFGTSHYRGRRELEQT